MRRAWIVVRKEWAEVFKNRFVLFTVAFLPLVLTLLPLVILFVTTYMPDAAEASNSDMPAAFAQFCGTELNELECAQYFLVSQFMILFMLLPLAIPVTFASYSIIGEKTTRTLEPVLATPITTMELLGGKVLAAAIPAVAVTWLAFAVFLGGATQLVAGPGVMARLMDPLWFIAVFVVGPLLALAAVSVAVMVSSRASDPRSAEQLSMFVILPLLGVFFGQLAGLVIIDTQMVVWMALGMVAIDTVLFAGAVTLFQRETILTRWK